MARPRIPDHPAAQIRKVVNDWQHRNDTAAGLRARLLRLADQLDARVGDEDIEAALASQRLEQQP